MTTFTIHDEGTSLDATVLLYEWLPRVAERLEDHLGPSRAGGDEVHVMLSPTPVHERRFPPRSGEVELLVDADPGAPSTQVDASFYAHGIATTARRALQLPPAVSNGAPIICLDVDRITQIAAIYRVEPHSMLARSAAHELAHVHRGHIQNSTERVHGYVREGDAQRDAWQVFIDLLADPHWEFLAREARLAQVRLAADQPSAYQRFGRGSVDREHWQVAEGPKPNAYAIHAARPLPEFMKDASIELPVRSNGDRAPCVGDHIYLTHKEVVLGPWVVVGRTARPVIADKVDRAAINTLHECPGAPADLRLDYVHLRRRNPVRGRMIDSLRRQCSSTYVALEVDGNVMAGAGVPAVEVIAAYEARKLDEYAEFYRDHPYIEVEPLDVGDIWQCDVRI